MRTLVSLVTLALTAGLLVFAVAVVGGFWVFYTYGQGLPEYRQLEAYRPPVVTRLYAADGRLLAEYAQEKRIFVPVEAIPPMVRRAFLSAEDKSFYAHYGVDPFAIARAAMTNLRNAGDERRLVGASTITQQVAKNFLLSNEVSYERKIREAILALRLERALSKDRILELYLNEIYLGRGSYGVAAAALDYFGKPLRDLDLGEAAFLAALPKAPNNYNPVRSPAAAKGRRDWVLSRMAEDGVISSEAALEAQDSPLLLTPRGGSDVTSAEFFAEEVRRELASRYGEGACLLYTS
ncbi:MAG: transglycosylase domain-containing protein, partial [Alphaproteobacteria bacterium]|nr:transglycosylase domain-containing protein [Alphaproteobacteria bacterium]